MISAKTWRTFTANAGKNIVFISESVTYTPEEAYQFTIILITAHTCFTIFQISTQTQIIVLEKIVGKISIIGIEARVLRILVAITCQRIKTMLPNGHLIVWSKFQFVCITASIRLVSITCMPGTALIGIIGSIITLIMCAPSTTWGSKVILPPLNRLKCQCTGHTSPFSFVITFTFFVHSHRIGIFTTTKVLVPVTIYIFDRLSGIVNNSLAVLVSSIIGTVSMFAFEQVYTYFQHIIQEPMRQVHV